MTHLVPDYSNLNTNEMVAENTKKSLKGEQATNHNHVTMCARFFKFDYL
jgi:hypothetical protein